MIVAINTRLLLKGKMEGIGWFTYEIVKRMVLAHPEVEFHFLFDRPFDPAFLFSPRVKAHVIRPPVRHPLLFDWWYNWSVPRMLRRIKADVFVSTDGFCSLRTDVPQVLTIHDLNFMHFPEHVHTRYRHFLPKRTTQYVHGQAALTTVSRFSAADLRSTFALEKPVEVIYNAASEIFRPLLTNEKNEIRLRLTGGKPYFLFVSSIHPRKNLPRILQAYDAWRSSSNHDFPLVIVGRRFWQNQELDSVWSALRHKDEVIFAGSMDQTELALTIGAAHALVYTSLYEGFGIPIVEAMKCGVPVLTSTCSSMPEIAGEAALLVDPYDVGAIANGMDQLASNSDLHHRLSIAGLERAKAFDWSVSAEKLWHVILKTAKPHA
jgi:glycosyltransferase involved in cell wall biosynthesis